MRIVYWARIPLARQLITDHLKARADVDLSVVESPDDLLGAIPGAARPDWWIVTEVARRMGFAAAFTFGSPAEIFAEHAALSAFENDGRRAFDIGGLAGLGDAGYQDLAPVRWPAPRSGTSGDRLCGDGRFYTDDRRARFVPTPPADPLVAADPAFPLILNTGRVRDHWHTMTRTGRSPRLSGHIAEPFVEIMPLGEAPGTWHVKGSNLCRIGVTPDRRPGRTIIVSVIDNLVKGASGQAVQAMNIRLGLSETALGPYAVPPAMEGAVP